MSNPIIVRFRPVFSSLRLSAATRHALAAATLVATLATTTSCTRQARIERHLARAERYMEAKDYDNAEVEYAIVLRANPEEPQSIATLGIIFFDEGRLSLAASFLPKAEKLQPANLDVRLRLAMLDLITGRIEDARNEAMFVLQRRPDDEDAAFVVTDCVLGPKDLGTMRAQLQQLQPDAHPALLLALGLVDLREQKLNDAQTKFLAAQAKLPNSGGPSFALAQWYAVQKDVAKADEAFAKACALSSPWSPRQIRRARFLVQVGKPEEAKRMLLELTAKTPNALSAWMVLAGIASDEKKYDESLTYVRKVLARDALNHEALLLQAKVTFAKGDRSGAVTLLERAAKIFPKSPEPNLQLATYQSMMGDPDAAAASLNRVLTVAPALPAAVLMMAEVDLRRGRTADATKALTDFVQKHPTNGAARLLLAQAYRMQGNLNEALAVYRQIDASFTGNPQPAYLMGTVLMQLRRLSEARQAFDKALKISPTFLPAFEQQVNIDLLEKQPAVAKGRLKAKLVQEPNSAAYQLLLAKVNLFAGETNEAEAALQKVIELRPESPMGYYLLGQVYLQTKQNDKAIARLQESVAKNPRNVEAMALIAAIYDQQRKYPEACKYYEMALAVDPKLPVALNNLAYLYAEKLQELEKGFALAQRAREQLPHEPNVADTLGWIVFKKQQYPWALTLLTEAAEQLPSSADVQYHLGMVHYMLGHAQPAHDALERALALNETFDAAADARDALAILALAQEPNSADARSLLERHLRQYPNDPVALAHFGALQEAQGDVDHAQQNYAAALKSSPNNVTAVLGTIRLRLGRNDIPGALELARTSHQQNPDNPQVTHLLGKAAFASGNYRWSLSLLQECASPLSSDPGFQWDLAQAAYSNGQVEEARRAARVALDSGQAFTHAAAAREFLALVDLATDPKSARSGAAKIDQTLKASPTNVPSLMALATLQEQKPDWAAAASSYQKALAVYPEFVPAQRGFAIASAHLPTADAKAIPAALKARTAYPNDAALAKAFGILSYRTTEYSRARLLLQESIRDEEDAEALYYLGLAQAKLNDRTASDKSLQRAIELGLGGEQVNEARKLIEAHARERKTTADARK